jgi:adenosylcobinamide-phosphate synthase
MGLKTLSAFLVDLAVGDPPMLHPVRLLGRLIAALEGATRRIARTASQERVSGILIAGAVAGGAYAVTRGLLLATTRWPRARDGIEVWLLAMTIATRGLAASSLRVRRALDHGDLLLARRAVGEIVGRDTGTLDEAEIARAAVESTAESITDGITAPIFYGLLGGAPLAMAYRAANTLDSMLGHKDPRYLHLGWASAKLDDLVTWVPARLTAAMFPIAAALVGENAWGAARMILRDGRKHPSPNAGIPEAAMAGALGVRLGGRNTYDGEVEDRPYLGDPIRRVSRHDITRAVRVAVATAIVFVAAGVLIRRR